MAMEHQRAAGVPLLLWAIGAPCYKSPKVGFNTGFRIGSCLKVQKPCRWNRGRPRNDPYIRLWGSRLPFAWVRSVGQTLAPWAELSTKAVSILWVCLEKPENIFEGLEKMRHPHLFLRSCSESLQRWTVSSFVGETSKTSGCVILLFFLLYFFLGGGFGGCVVWLVF